MIESAMQRTARIKRQLEAGKHDGNLLLGDVRHLIETIEGQSRNIAGLRRVIEQFEKKLGRKKGDKV